jgi:hypothetical protein
LVPFFWSSQSCSLVSIYSVGRAGGTGTHIRTTHTHRERQATHRGNRTIPFVSQLSGCVCCAATGTAGSG